MKLVSRKFGQHRGEEGRGEEERAEEGRAGEIGRASCRERVLMSV